AQGDDARDPRQGALHLDAYALHLYGVVALGEELQRRAARGLRAPRPDLRPHLGRPGPQEEDGLLRWQARFPSPCGEGRPRGPLGTSFDEVGYSPVRTWPSHS